MSWMKAPVGAVFVLLCLGASRLSAQDLLKQTQEKGHDLALTLCKGCHLVDDKVLSPVPVGIPTFRAIANRTGQTGEKIKDVLIRPHTPMPEIQLSNDEILIDFPDLTTDDISAALAFAADRERRLFSIPQRNYFLIKIFPSSITDFD